MDYDLLAACIWLLICKKSAEGSDIDCTVGCVCCRDRVCGPNQWFSSGVCTKGCIDGYAGWRCYKKCPEKCKICIAENNRENCIVCYDGYFPGPGRDCLSKCLPNCKTCSSGNSCTSCKEEYYSDNGFNDCSYRKCPENCKCENGQCSSCKEGFYDTSNSCNGPCPNNCGSCSSSSNCESCKDGYYNGYQNDDSNLPLFNNCTYKCRVNCIKCLSYNVCMVCKSGRYGSICEKTCSVGCLSGICDMQTRNCNCYSDFVRDKCDKCQNGKHGIMCDKQCSKGCKGDVCEKESGNCIDGCIVDTVVGDKCDVCSTGGYGPYCNISCSVGCTNNQCKRIDGECTYGCLNNFIGKQCDQCTNGEYGDKCNSYCPDNCDAEGCLKESGYCINCAQNFDGEKCDKCVIGLHGLTCSKTCPPKCLHIACERNIGTCSYGCVDNYSGDRCCLSNNNCINCLTDTKCKQCKSGYFTDQCDESCHQNCIDSCNIRTGICDNCKSNFYGEHCQLSCASTCSYQSNTSENRCHRTDGTCLHGCANGFHGCWCSKNCSIYCIDNICNQGDGKCIKGCQSSVLDSSICSLDADPLLLEQQKNTVAVVLGTILAVTLVGYVILVVILILRKCRQRESTGKPVYENADIELKCNTERIKKSPSDEHASPCSSKDMAKSRDYEDLSGVQVTEHEYGDIRISA